MTVTPESSHLDKVGYLFGDPIAHSLSPLFHQTVFDSLGLNWSQQLLESLDIPHFLTLIQKPQCFGSAVTMPHKLAIIPHLDELTSEGREVGACNTIFFRYREDGSRVLVGTNTDVVGIRDSFYANVKSPDDVFHSRPSMVIGGGGAARSAVYALRKWMESGDVYIVNRDKAEVDAVIAECKARGYGERLMHVATPEQAEGLEGPGAIVSCVPNYPPKTENEIAARKAMEVMLNKQHKGAILEMCYHPTVWTEIAEISKQAGWQVILGTEAMIYQGLAQSKCWTGKDTQDLPVKRVHSVIAAKLGDTEVLRRTENA